MNKLHFNRNPGPAQRAALCVLVCLFFAGGCTRFDALNSTVPCWGYERTRNIVYGDKPRQTLDVYRPAGMQAGARVVIFFYGGFWASGSKEDYRFVAQALSSEGFLTIMPDYRLYPDVAFPAFVQDCALAVKWARENAAKFGGDPDQIYLMGHSAGAYNATLLTLDARFLSQVGLSRDAIKGTVAMSGPYDFTPGPELRPVFGAGPDEILDSRLNATTLPDGHEPPILLIHGAADDVVGVDNAKKLAAAIQARGGHVQTIYYEKLGHPGVVLAMAWPFRWLAPVLHDAAEFIRSPEAQFQKSE